MKKQIDGSYPPITEGIMQENGFHNVQFERNEKQVATYNCELKDGTKIKAKLKFDVWGARKITLSAEIEDEDESIDVNIPLSPREGINKLYEDINNRDSVEEVEEQKPDEKATSTI